MKALRVVDRSINVAEVQKPAVGGESLVRVLKSGICNTDLEIARGYAGFNGTIGHEFVGVVEASDDGLQLAGKRVVGEINVGCGHCELCVAGDPRHCPTRTVLGIHGRDGAHAEFLKLPSRNLIPVPESVSDDAAVFAEPLAAAYGISERVEFGPSDDVYVIGDGKLGLLCAFCLSLKSSRVRLVGRHAEKLTLAESRGIETINAADVAKLTLAADIVVEASGSESGFASALAIIKPKGKIVLKSTFHGTSNWDTSRIVVDELSIIGSRCGRLAPAIELLASKKVNVDDLISEEYPLTNGVNALDRAGKPGILKVLLRP